MFQFPGLPPPSLCIQLGVAGHDPRRVPPFGHPGIAGRLRLPQDYRGLPRPSSASCAKASAARPYYLRFPLVSVSQKMISDGYAHRSIALRSQMRLSWLLQSPPRGGPQENRIVYVREPCDLIHTCCVYLDENAMQLSRCAGPSPGSRMLGTGAAGRAASSRVGSTWCLISLERR